MIEVDSLICGSCVNTIKYAMTMDEAVDLTKDNIFYDSHCYESVIVRVKAIPHANQVKIEIVRPNMLVIESYRLFGDCTTLKDVESGEFTNPTYVPTCPAGWEKV